MTKSIHILLLEILLRQRLCCALVSSEISSNGSIDAMSPQEQKVVQHKFIRAHNVDHVKPIPTALTKKNKKKKVSRNCEASLVINIGLPRSGTTTFSVFLKTLGYEENHFAQDVDLNEVLDFAAGTDDESSYLRDGMWSKEGASFSDWPYYSVACSLLAAKPVDVDARFILVKRELTDWANSLRTLWCFYTGCSYDNVILPWFFGSVAEQARDTCRVSKDELCSSTADENSKWQDMVPDFQTRAELHYNEVQTCFAAHPELLLQVDLEDSDEHKAQLIHDFLGCSGDVQPMSKAEDHVM